MGVEIERDMGRLLAFLGSEFGNGPGHFLSTDRPSAQRAVAIRPLIGSAVFYAIWTTSSTYVRLTLDGDGPGFDGFATG